MGEGHSMIHIMFIGCKISMSRNKNDILEKPGGDFFLTSDCGILFKYKMTIIQ